MVTYMHDVDYTKHPLALKNSTFYLQVTHHECKIYLHCYVFVGSGRETPQRAQRIHSLCQRSEVFPSIPIAF